MLFKVNYLSSRLNRKENPVFLISSTCCFHQIMQPAIESVVKRKDHVLIL